MELFPYVDLKNNLLLKQDASDKGKPHGFAGLDGQGRVPFAQLPVSITSLATNAEVVANKGAANGYAPLNNQKRIPDTFMPVRYGEAIQTLNWWEQDGLPELVRILQEDVAPKEAGVPEGGLGGQVLAKKSGADNDVEWAYPPALDYATVEEIEAGESTTKVVTPFGFDRQIVKVREREEGREYKADSLILYDDKLWRASVDTDATPGPETIVTDLTDDTQWSQTFESNLIPLDPSGEAVVGDGSIWAKGTLYYNEPFPSTLFDSGWAMEFEYVANASRYVRNELGVYMGSSPNSSVSWNTYTLNIEDSNAGAATGGLWANGRIEIETEGSDFRFSFYKEGTLIETKLYPAASGLFRPRFLSYGNGSPVLKIRNVTFPSGPDHPDWLWVSDIGATNRFNKLKGRPSAYPPAAHVHAAGDITSGTVAATRLPSATETSQGIVERATAAEVTAGTDTTRYVSPAGLKNVLDARFAEVAGSTDLRAVNRASNGTWPARPAGAVNVLWIDLTSNAPSDPVDLDPEFDVILDPGVV